MRSGSPERSQQTGVRLLSRRETLQVPVTESSYFGRSGKVFSLKGMSSERQLLEGAYRDFNARRMDAVLARMRPDVVWPNGMEGGFVYGREGVRDYWTRQWAILDPNVEPLDICPDQKGRWVVKVRQVVHDRQGKLLVDQIVRHTYEIRDFLIARMDIE